jgi:integrase
MTDTDTIENWLNTVAYSHSNSNNTRIQYTHHIQKFLNHIGKTADQILEEYQTLDDKQFKHKYTPLIMSLIGEMEKANYSSSTQHNVIATIKSFFKYNSLPLSYLPLTREYLRFHNRPITKEEIKQIIKESQPRERAYYSLMTQSGLRPQTISNLKIENLENLLEPNTPIPCLITIRQEITKGKYSEYFTFTAEESIKHIKEYLKRQRKQPLTPEEYLFTMQNGKTPVKPDVINHIFARTIKNLRKENILDFKTDSEIVNNKTRTNNKLKLYNLRKYFRNNNHADWDYKNFWMGHISKLGVDKHYIDTSTTPENIEKHRQIYKEKAMPHLKIETTTPDEIVQTATKLETENQELKNQIETMQQNINKIWQVLTKYPRTVIEPIHKETAIKELLSTPEENQIDLTPNQQNIKLRRKLIAKTKQKSRS